MSHEKNIKNYAKNLTCNLFATGNDIESAYKNAINMIDSIDGVDRCTAMTALHMVLNTISKDLQEIVK